MNVLLVNNDTEPDNWLQLQKIAVAAGYNVSPIHHSAIGAIDPRGYDLVILSGGWWASDQDQLEILKIYAEELRFIEETRTPILGICVGMLLIHVAMGQAAPLLDEQQYGIKPIDVNIAGQMLFGFPEKIEVFKNHDRGVVETEPEFETLASSPGHAEIILHKTKPLLGVQFHPEVGDTDKAAKMLKTLVDGLIRVPIKS